MSHLNHPYDPALLEAISEQAEVGYLGIVTPDGYPRVVPVNFVSVGDRVFIHGATSGEKFDALASRQKVTFCIAVPYAQLPSYWRSPEYACPATQFFKSVLIRGRGAVETDPGQKAVALQALMDKYQPEGGFREIDPADSLYSRPIAEVAIFKIDPDGIDIRSKFGDQLSRETRLSLIGKLRERGGPRDMKTALEMEKRLKNGPTEEDKS